MTTFGTILRELRTARRFSQPALGETAGVDPSFISRAELGRRPPPSLNVVLALIRALALSDADADRLLLAAGHPPTALQRLGTSDPTVLAVARLLADVTTPPERISTYRTLLEGMVQTWGRATG